MIFSRLVIFFVLLSLTIYSCLLVVNTRYEYRRAYTYTSKEEAVKQKYLAEIHELDAQKRSLINPIALEKKAIEDLHMQPASKNTVIVNQTLVDGLLLDWIKNGQ